MNIIVSGIYIALIAVFAFRKDYTNLIVLMVLSLLGNMFYFDFYGSRIQAYQLIPLSVIFFDKVFYKVLLNNIIREIRYEYILLLLTGFLFGYLIPWDIGDSERTWSQLPEGRTIVALIRIALEINIIYFVYFVFVNDLVEINELLNIISFFVIFIVLVAIVDAIIGYPIYKHIFNVGSYFERMSGRLLGFSHEPRGFARTLEAMVMLLFISYINGYQFKFRNTSVIVGMLGVLLSFSFSSYILLGVSFVYLYKSEIFKARSLFIFMGVVIIGFIFYYMVKDNPKIALITSRYDMVTEGREEYLMEGENVLFTRFELFDRAALNFFSDNPQHLLIGTGPNLIGIPSSKYMDKSAIVTFQGQLSGIPGIGLVNLLSRSGIIGLLLYLLFYFKISHKLKKLSNKYLGDIFTISFITYLLVQNPIFFFAIGFVLSEMGKNISDQDNI
ncbi:MAG: hypothetical protein HGB12_00350 [Bacteroidetes bacterium]|nr:hypothetical protein [Bacteroidota bacterium]